MSNQDTARSSTGSRILLDNARVRVFERRIRAGEKTRMHSHPDHVIYGLKDSRTKYIYPDGTEKIIELKTGDVIFKQAETHIAKLISPKESLDILIELK